MMLAIRTASIAALLSFTTIVLTTPAPAAPPPLVVETDPLSPDEQREQFGLPPGFRIELIASEPDIGQPMNMNFDAAGRLWVTHSVEYPYPVEGPGVEPRDENFGPNGQPPARDRLSIINGIGTGNLQISHVVDGLNIPIGIVPLSTSSAIGYSIPNISLLTIEANSQPSTLNPQPLLGPFGNVDTHGMVNGLTHWIDGWVYACHGFRNTSTIKDADGHEITMNSGNTFRFRPDGSHVEQWTWGQVNPFGMTFDPWGNLYTADCHSMPLTCLIPGAYYPSFGKPHDGLGFGPDMIDHSHGSTGICGPCYYAADHFPPEYRDCLYLCNPVTGRVHRDKLIWHGSTPQADTQPDFITCKDGWFRPVDIQLGPDGALYIADFYNAIIGHYEVPLDNPRRDRTRGRIWRVTYTGDPQASRGRQPPDDIDPPQMPDLTSGSDYQPYVRLNDLNLTVRVLASHQIVERADARTPDLLRQTLHVSHSPRQKAHLLWLLQRLGVLTENDWQSQIDHTSPLLRTHVARLIGDKRPWSPEDRRAVVKLLRDEDARVRRAAAEAISLHPTEAFVDDLQQSLSAVADPDTHLRYALRIALRNCLRPEGALRSRLQAEATSNEIASVCLGIESAESAAYLLNHLGLQPEGRGRQQWITHIARHGSFDNVGSLAALLRSRKQVSLADQVADLKALQAGQELSSRQAHPELLAWATVVARQLLDQVADQSGAWQSLPLPASGRGPAEWGLETRTATDGRPTRLWSSLPGGEQSVGIARSPSFAMPAELTFRLAGHDGFPEDDAAGKNLVRLVRDADGAVLQSQPAPRQDPPVEVTWPAGDDAGASVRIELVDGLDREAYAWIAAGRFSVPSLNPREQLPSQRAAELITSLRLSELQPELRQQIADPGLSATAVADLSSALLALAGDYRLSALHGWLVAAPQSGIARRVRQQIVEGGDVATDQLLVDAMRSAPGDRQQAMAEVLAGHADGAERLIELIRQGHASPRLLQSPPVQQKLQALRNRDLLDQAGEITRDLPAASDQAAVLIRRRRDSFLQATPSIERGREIFKKTCAACHQIGTEGNKVGPQLDGVGIRGLDRLLEDTLDPNRNVDAAFRSTTILTTDGRVLTGLLRREEGETLVLADSKGEEFRVARDDIEQQALSPLSLMPADIAARLPEASLYDLLAYLLSQRETE